MADFIELLDLAVHLWKGKEEFPEVKRGWQKMTHWLRTVDSRELDIRYIQICELLAMVAILFYAIGLVKRSGSLRTLSLLLIPVIFIVSFNTLLLRYLLVGLVSVRLFFAFGIVTNSTIIVANSFAVTFIFINQEWILAALILGLTLKVYKS